MPLDRLDLEPLDGPSASVTSTVAPGCTSSLKNTAGPACLVETTAPGPVGDALSTAIDQARSAGQAGRITARAFGPVGSLVTAASGMGQL